MLRFSFWFRGSDLKGEWIVRERRLDIRCLFAESYVE
jgi:hypothetical protein